MERGIFFLITATLPPQENTYPSPNFPNGHERLSTYRSLTSALTGTRALQSIENKIDRIEALTYQKEAKSATTVDKGSSLISQDREALEGMMKSSFDSFLGQVAGSVGQMVHQEVVQHLATVRSAMVIDFDAAQESMMAKLQESREQNRAETSREIRLQLQGLLESIKAEGTIRHQGTEERLAKLLSDRSADILGIQQEQERQAELQEQRDHKETQNVVGSVQELREAVEKMIRVLHMLETNDLAHQRELRHMISEQQQGLVAAHRTRCLDKDDESKRHLEVDENFSAIETRVAELAEDFSELAEKLLNQHEVLVKEIEGLKRRQAQILTLLQENHHQQQRYLESILQSPAMSEVVSGTTLVNAPQAASAARQRAMRPTRGSRATEPNDPPHGPPNNGRENPEAPTDPSLSNSNNGQIVKRKRIKIEPRTIPKPAERTMTTRMMSKVLGGIVT
ncbi:hypothetical protein BGZ81_005341 [Podila clonocystis]|nr:hypothetical protein BGZ81_005341 [Podila clonocystis]